MDESKAGVHKSDRHTFLIINPGSTSTKVSLFSGTGQWNLSEINSLNLAHDPSELSAFPRSADQLELRLHAVTSFLKKAGNPRLSAVAGRGGLTRPLEAGSYAIDEALESDLTNARYGDHASNLGALIAKAIASETGIPALISDPVGVDQFDEPARYSGWPEIERLSQLHALNMRAVARQASREITAERGENKGTTEMTEAANMNNFRFVIAHLGGGISIGPMKDGRIIDVNHAMDGGPFSPQRVGSLPTTALIDLCFSGMYPDSSALKSAMTRKGGLLAYLGTDDLKEIIRRIDSGNKEAKEVLHAMCYQIAKEIGAMSTVLHGQIDAILLTGGLAREPVSRWIAEMTGWIAPIREYPGEGEMIALAQAAARHICEGEELRTYGRK